MNILLVAGKLTFTRKWGSRGRRTLNAWMEIVMDFLQKCRREQHLSVEQFCWQCYTLRAAASSEPEQFRSDPGSFQQQQLLVNMVWRVEDDDMKDIE